MTNDVKLSAPKRKRKIASLDRRKARAGWFLVYDSLDSGLVSLCPL